MDILNRFLDVALMPALAALLSGLATWVFARKKNAAEVDGTNISNMHNALGFYTAIINDSKEQTDKLSELNKSLFLENLELKQRLSALQVEVNDLRLEIDKLKKQVDANSKRLK